mgnify:FL=1|tara:strand:- start:2950 stop:3861 length:912 start_codon:yes stop_codon:yes gene_type:complete
MTQTSGVIDPAILDRLSGLSLVAHKVVEGFMAGHHRSPHKGSSVEFAQHRPYAPGDELRKIDWKVFARSDRLVVKEYVEETNLSLNVLLDASESMAFGSLNWTKFDYARWCAAALAHLVIGQRDTAGLVIFDAKHRIKVPPANGAPQEAAILKALEQTEPTGPTAVGGALDVLTPRLRHRGITVVLSDFFDDIEAILDGVKRLVHAGHEPILFQILDPLEVTFDFDRLVKLEGLEGLGSKRIDPKALREAYIAEIEAHNQELARAARALSVDFVSIRTDEPLDAVISAYLARRTARARGGRSL